MTWFLAIFVFIFGAIIGSFLNCLAWRLYHNQSLWGRSACPSCHKMIAWFDNIPVISWLALGAKCRHCQQKISFQYWLMEVIVGLLFLFSFYYHFSDISNDPLLTFNFITFNSMPLWLMVRDWLLLSFLAIIFIMDLRWYVVADQVSLSAIVIILIVNLLLGFSWVSLVSAAIIGGGFFALQYVVSRGHWVGAGDIRIGALMGVALGFPLVLVALMLSYLSGAIIGLILIAFKKKALKSPIPFGVFLAPATLVALWWGQAIWQWYLGLLF